MSVALSYFFQVHLQILLIGRMIMINTRPVGFAPRFSANRPQHSPQFSGDRSQDMAEFQALLGQAGKRASDQLLEIYKKEARAKGFQDEDYVTAYANVKVAMETEVATLRAKEAAEFLRRLPAGTQSNFLDTATMTFIHSQMMVEAKTKDDPRISPEAAKKRYHNQDGDSFGQ
jgi:hypothetical protein